MMQSAFDHAVYAVSDLDRACEAFADQTGTRPLPGGTHPHMGTENALISFGDAAYLELLAPAKESADAKNLGGRIKEFDSARLFAWSLRLDDLKAVRPLLSNAGLDPTSILPSSRKQANGETLAWDLLGLKHFSGAWPFFISWGATPHPSSEAPRVGSILQFSARLPVSDLDALPFSDAEGVQLEHGPPRISLAFYSTRGPVEWEQDEPVGFFS